MKNKEILIRAARQILFCIAICLIFSTPEETSQHWYATFAVTKTCGVVLFIIATTEKVIKRDSHD